MTESVTAAIFLSGEKSGLTAAAATRYPARGGSGAIGSDLPGGYPRYASSAVNGPLSWGCHEMSSYGCSYFPKSPF